MLAPVDDTQTVAVRESSQDLEEESPGVWFIEASFGNDHIEEVSAFGKLEDEVESRAIFEHVFHFELREGVVSES